MSESPLELPAEVPLEPDPSPEEGSPELAVTCLLIALWAPLIVMTLLGTVALALALAR